MLKLALIINPGAWKTSKPGARKNCPRAGRLRLYVNYLFIGVCGGMGGDGNVPLKQTRVGVIRQSLQQASNSIHSEFKLRRAPLLPFPHPFSLHPLYFPSLPDASVPPRTSECAAVDALMRLKASRRWP